ncbi:MAG: hypothetical protein WCJ46_04230 [bacterium]
MKWNLKAYILGIILILFPYYIFADGFAITKSISPSNSTLGQIVTVCLSISSSGGVAKADVVWVLDVTGSMTAAIASIKNNITAFTSQLASKGIDYRQAFISYRDFGDVAPYPQLHDYGFASSDTQFTSWVASETASGGGDGPEAGLEAIMEANNNLPWRTDASKTIILVTDSTVHVSSDGGLYLYTIASVVTALKNKGIVCHTICYDWSTTPLTNPKNISALTGGMWLDFGATNWAPLLTTLGDAVSKYTNVVVRDPMPPELKPVGDVCGATVNSNQLSWTFSTVGSGAVLSVCCFQAQIVSDFTGSIVNKAYVSAAGITETSSDGEYVFSYTKTITATQTATPTMTCTVTKTMTSTVTQTVTQTYTKTSTPTMTSTYTQTMTKTATETQTSTFTKTDTPTMTCTSTKTFTQTNTPTKTYTGTPTNTKTSTETNTPTFTKTATPTMTGTNTPTMTKTSTNTNTPTFTKTSTPTMTGTNTPTMTKTSTATNTPTFTQTSTRTFTSTNTPTMTLTSTQTNTPELSKTITPTNTYTYTATVTLTVTETATPTISKTATMTNTCTNTPTLTLTYTDTYTPTVTQTMTPTSTITETSTATQTFTETFTTTNTATITPTETDTNTATITKTMTETFTTTNTATITETKTCTNTPTITKTITKTSTPTASATVTPTVSNTQTPTITNTTTQTVTPTSTQTATPTSTPVLADIVITIDSDTQATRAGNNITIFVKVKNIGATAGNVLITGTVPTGTEFVSGTGWILSGSVLNYVVGSLAAGAEATYTFVLQVGDVPDGNKIQVPAFTCDYNDAIYTNSAFHKLSNTLTILVGDILIYPNPFNPQKAVGGKMKFLNLPWNSMLFIYTLSGELVTQWRAKTDVDFYWDGKNYSDSNVSPGIYYYVITFPNKDKPLVGKIFVVKN